jgi:hypothetical protein
MPTVRGYAVFDGDNYLMLWTVSATEHKACERFADGNGEGIDMINKYRTQRGLPLYRVAPVDITEVV